MRWISQDGTIDVPYEQVSIEIRNGTEQCEIWCGYSSILERICVAKSFARYSTQEKALKAMQMLHECYTGMLYMRNVDFGKDVDVKERPKESLTHGIGFISVFDTEENVKIEPINIVFRFPKEDEV